MAYLGNPPAAAYTAISYQDLTGGSGTSFTLDYSVGSAQDIEVFVNNVRQEPGVAYTVAGTGLTMTGSISASDDFYVVFQGKAQQTVSHPAGNALQATTGTFSSNVDVGGSLLVDTIKDGSNTNTAMTIDSSGQVLLSAIPYIRMKSTGTVSVNLSTSKIVPFNNVIASRGITLNTSTYKFQVPVTGLYHFSGAVRWDSTASYLWWRVDDGTGTAVQDSSLILNGMHATSGVSFVTSTGAFLCPLTASTDYQISFGDGTNNTANISDSQTFMAIYLVGAN